MATSPVRVEPVTTERWDDLVELFGSSGASSGCWCMWWRVTSSDFEREAGAGLRARAETLVVGEDRVPGLLAYRDGRPVGWVAVAPRSEYGRMQRSPKLKPVDETPVWMVSCFFIRRDQRGTGVATALLDAAVVYAYRQGASAVEGVPIDTSGTRPDPPSLFTGTLAMFEAAGFEEIARRGGRPIVRRRFGAVQRS